ncbi:MAG: ATP synthase F1 subunit gamma [Lachnospiraceae bacterium]|nr:ATP synthase F1 subunit gamma [Lachnospiraceae bacterium]
MASMTDIKRRKQSVSSTQKITKAMKLVSTVKLQKAKQKAENTDPYFNYMYNTVCSMLDRAGAIEHPYLKAGESKKKAVITISSNKGLAGGYNGNITKLITESDQLDKEDVLLYTIGKKAHDMLKHKGYDVATQHDEVMEAPTFDDAMDIGQEVLDAFTNGEVGEIYLAYTHFKNTVVHEPKLLKLLPVEIPEEDRKKDDKDDKMIMTFEPNPEEALDMIVPKYINSLIYGALIEAVASENGARMQAMDSATSNAEDIISDLTLKYNRARQESITQELTEIIGGAEAIS